MFKPSSPEKQLEWKEKIRLQERSGLSMEKWCRQNQVAPHNLKYWKQKFSSKPPKMDKSSFSELPLANTSTICIEYKGIRIRLNDCLDFTLLKECLSALKGLKC